MRNLSNSERYKKAQAYTQQERLPIGGYVIEIKNVEYKENDWGDTVVLSFDIAEGEHKGFYMQNYKSQTAEDKKWKGTYRLPVPKDDGTEQDEWKMRRFKTVIEAFEDSNKGYHWNWDENTLKGKIVGALFNNKEYEFNGRHGFFTNCHSLINVEKIRKGDFKIPEDTLLNGTATQSATSNTGWMNVGDAEAEELPF